MASAAGLEPAHQLSPITSSFQDYPLTIRVKPTFIGAVDGNRIRISWMATRYNNHYTTTTNF